MTAQIQRIKACLNGKRSRAAHPAVPETPGQLAAEAAAAMAAGAEAVHMHPRDTGGRESLQLADIGAAVAAVRRGSPGTPVGVSTGLWITGGDVAARLSAVTGWADLPGEQRPDFASVNLSEPGTAGLLAALDAAGIGAEAGVWSVADARAAASLQPARGWLRIMVELIGLPAAAALAATDEILAELAALGLPARGLAAPLLHAEEDACWPVLRRAGQLGLATRIGLEDTTTGPSGQPVGGNADLVMLALAEWTAARPG